MRRLAGCLIVAILASLVETPMPAWAHGGAYKPPPIWNPNPRGPAPGRRAPDATTPPPIPGPVTPGTGAPPGTRGTAITPSEPTEQTWRMWWILNRYRFLAHPVPRPPTGVVTPGPATPGPSAYERDLIVARARVAPFLLHLIASSAEDDDVRASALLALAKVSNDDRTLDAILGRLHAADAPDLVRSSAALALGLLRRSDASQQRDGASLDQARDALFELLDDPRHALEVRTFAALGLGLLGDQPHGSQAAKDGRLVIHGLWKRLGRKGEATDVRVAMLTALGLQPRAGMPEAVTSGLEQLVVGRGVHGRVWSPLERSHALCAQVRLGGAGAHAALLRVLSHGRELPAIRRAAYLAVGRFAYDCSPEERFQAARAVLALRKRTQDPFSEGLGLVALGHLLGADHQAGGTDVLRKTSAGKVLLETVASRNTHVRGFAVIALGLAARTEGADDTPIAPFLHPARRALVRGLLEARARYPNRGGLTAAIGYAEARAGKAALLALLEDDQAHAWNRTVAALALGSLGDADPAVRNALARATTAKVEGLPPAAARALASLGGSLSDTQLAAELQVAKSTQRAADILLALGRLQDPRAAAPLIAWARDESHADAARALAVVALGLLGDPEPRPSLSRVTRDGNYPSRTKALAEAWTLY